MHAHFRWSSTHNELERERESESHSYPRIRSDICCIFCQFFRKEAKAIFFCVRCCLWWCCSHTAPKTPPAATFAELKDGWSESRVGNTIKNTYISGAARWSAHTTNITPTPDYYWLPHTYIWCTVWVCVCCVCVLLGHAVCSLNDEKTVVIVFRLNGNVTYSCFLFFLGTWESLCLSVSIRHQPCRDCWTENTEIVYVMAGIPIPQPILMLWVSNALQRDTGWQIYAAMAEHHG